MSGRLVVCPTPIGNLEDVTLRVLAALREADVVACEDTRRTRVLLERYGVPATLVSYHEHNERERAAELVERMRGGAVVALVSRRRDAAGLRPGLRARAGLRRRRAGGRGAARAVGGARRAGGERRCRPTRGASRASCRASAARWRRCFGSPETLVAFESPAPRRRLAGGRSPSSTRTRPVAVCRELTKLHEEVVRGTRRRAGRALRGRAAARRGRAGRRRRARRARASTRPRSTPSAGWSRPAPARARPPRSWPSSRAEPPTSCTEP